MSEDTKIGRNSYLSVAVVIAICGLVWAVASDRQSAKARMEKLEEISATQMELLKQNSERLRLVETNFAALSNGRRWTLGMEIDRWESQPEESRGKHPRESYDKLVGRE